MRKMTTEEYLKLPCLSELCNINLEKAKLYIEGKSTDEVDKKYNQTFSSKVFWREGNKKGRINKVTLDKENNKLSFEQEEVELIDQSGE